MKKKCKIILLPTENESSIWSHKGRRLYFNQANFNDKNDEIRYHLYITSDDEIKENDWFIQIHQGNKSIVKCDKQNKSVINTNQSRFLKAFKIIATTETSLNLQQLSQELIKAYCDKPFDEIKVEYEQPLGQNPSIPSFMQESLKLKTDSYNNIITSFIKDSYSREEVISLIKSFIDIDDNHLRHTSKFKLDNWIKQNL